MAQRTRLGREHQLGEQLAFGLHAGVELAHGSRHRVDALAGRGEVLRHALDHVARELQIGFGLGVLARQVAHQRQRALAGDVLGKRARFRGQRIRRSRDQIKQLLAGNRSEHFALHGFAADDHVQRGFQAQQARQALRAAGAGQQAELDFGQGDRSLGRDHAVVAAHGQLQAAAHADRMNRRDHRLGRLLEHLDHRQQMRLLRRALGAEFGDVGAARKGLARTRDDDRLDAGIGIRLVHPLDDGPARGQAQAVDRRIVQRDDGDGAVLLVVSAHAVVPCGMEKNDRAFLL